MPLWRLHILSELAVHKVRGTVWATYRHHSQSACEENQLEERGIRPSSSGNGGCISSAFLSHLVRIIKIGIIKIGSSGR